MISSSSLGRLGQTAPNPLPTTTRSFRHEHEEHIHGKRCRAKTCTALVKSWVDPEQRRKCGLCVPACPVGAIKWEKKGSG
jgi:ferredoxin